jgi:VCBS repeat-containing protein
MGSPGPYVTQPALTVSATGSGVLTGAADAASGTLTATLVTNVQDGTLSLSSNGQFTYTPTK